VRDTETDFASSQQMLRQVLSWGRRGDLWACALCCMCACEDLTLCHPPQGTPSLELNLPQVWVSSFGLGFSLSIEPGFDFALAPWIRLHVIPTD